MADPVSDPKELMALAHDFSMASRQALFSAIKDLFNENGGVLTERERALMRDILGKLLRDTQLALRRELVEVLGSGLRPGSRPNSRSGPSSRSGSRSGSGSGSGADPGKGPEDNPQRIPWSDAAEALLPMLADPQEEMPLPDLAAKTALRDPTLIEAIRTRTLRHQLSTAMRRLVSTEVGGPLLPEKEPDTIRALLDSDRQDLAAATMDYLVEESRQVDSYQEPLVRWEDLPAEQAQRLCLWVGAALRRHLLPRIPLRSAELDDALLAAIDRMKSAAADLRSQRPAAATLADRLMRNPGLKPQQIVHILREGEVFLFEALLSELTGLETRRLQRVLYDSDGRSLAIACRASGFGKTLFAQLFLLCRKGRASERLGDSQEIAEVMAFFDRVDPDAAGCVLRLWQCPWPYQDAIDQV